MLISRDGPARLTLLMHTLDRGLHSHCLLSEMKTDWQAICPGLNTHLLLNTFISAPFDLHSVKDNTHRSYPWEGLSTIVSSMNSLTQSSGDRWSDRSSDPAFCGTSIASSVPGTAWAFVAGAILRAGFWRVVATRSAVFRLYRCKEGTDKEAADDDGYDRENTAA